MALGILKKMVHLSQQRGQPGTRLVADHNDVGYGIIEDAEGREVYVSHESVDSRNGFYDLRPGQQLEYTVEKAAYLRASWARIVPGSPTRDGGPEVA